MVCRRLAACLALSALLHGMMAGLYRPAPWPAAEMATPPPLQWVEWVPRPVPSQDTGPGRPAVHVPVPVTLPKPQAAMELRASAPPVLADTAPKPADAMAHVVVHAQAEPSKPSPLHLEDLLEQARRIGQESAPAAALPSAWPPGPAEADRPVLPALDRALAKPVPGIRRYAHGLFKVVTESGRVYCMQEPPAYAGGGPVEPLAVASNCP